MTKLTTGATMNEHFIAQAQREWHQATLKRDSLRIYADDPVALALLACYENTIRLLAPIMTGVTR